mgnify:CR=1 FL=1
MFRRKQRYYWIDKKSRKGEISIPASTLTLYETNWYFDKILNTRFANRIYLLGNIGFVIIRGLDLRCKNLIIILNLLFKQ